MRRAVRLGHPDFGKAFPCECTVDEQADEKVARLHRYSNLGPLARLTFENLSPRGRSPHPDHQERFSEAVKAGLEFADRPAGWLVFSGPSGSGKTHLAAAIAGRCIEGGQAALFMVVPDLLDHLRASYQQGTEVPYDDLFELVRNAPVLVLDDLGVQSATPWAEEKLFQLINHRYNAQMPTVFTTNLDLAQFGQRMQTRLGDAALSRVFCFESGLAAELSELDSLKLPLLQKMTFKAFDPRLAASSNEEIKDLERAYQEAMKFANDPRDWLIFAGATGRGKTRLAAAVANFCREAGRRVMFVVVPDLLDRLRSSYSPGTTRSFEDIFEEVRSFDLLVLDDLGAQSGTPWADEKLFQLINHRYNASLPTVITTNCTKRNLDARLFTRLSDPQVSTILPLGPFNFFGTDEPVQRTPQRGRPRRA